MCGLTGFWNFNAASHVDLPTIAAAMAERIRERGPDSSGSWYDQHAEIAFAHRRLAIRDLSPEGVQPMRSGDGRWVIAYNGEIYNTTEIKSALGKVVSFRGHSDTEVLLCALEKWGVAATLKKLNGMFAFVLWDCKQQELYLVRDRIGIKPLYFGFNNNVLFFGSQLKSFSAHPVWQPEINFDALASFFRVSYIVAPSTIYKNIYKVKPGFFVKVDRKGKLTETQYWSLASYVGSGVDADVDNLQDLLRDAVSRRLVADVPVGAFLSGGIDSSLVVALMQESSMRPVQTFSIGFNEAEFNEAHYAKKVAEHLGTEHHELYLTDQASIDLIPEIPSWYDEPFADVSQLPTLLVSRLAKSRVSVSLSGDGGDELFAGYTRYHIACKLRQRLLKLPKIARTLFSKGIMTIKPSYWDHLARVIPSSKRPSQLGDKAYKFARLLQSMPQDFCSAFVSQWPDSTALIRTNSTEPGWPKVRADNFIREMQLLDALTYLPADILTKVDRASMAVSLEARVPLLDHRVAEFAFGLPQDLLIQNNKGKWILREILSRYIPRELIERPKMGFGVPIGCWLRGSLRDWAEDLLGRQALLATGLNPEPIQKRWNEHLSGLQNWQYPLWGVLMYQAWRRQY